MRKLVTIQKREKLNDVYAYDERGVGNANHEYIIKRDDESYQVLINFQNGGRNEPSSTKGVLDVDLLEIVRDRLSSFQEGEFESTYNAKALNHIESALMFLNRRVEDRIEENKLGKNIK